MCDTHFSENVDTSSGYVLSYHSDDFWLNERKALVGKLSGLCQKRVRGLWWPSFGAHTADLTDALELERFM